MHLRAGVRVADSLMLAKHFILELDDGLDAVGTILENFQITIYVDESNSINSTLRIAVKIVPAAEGGAGDRHLQGHARQGQRGRSLLCCSA
jgi:hypothetical protein